MDLRQARRRLPYLARLGISHLYLSPVLAARQGSTHGYDVVDPTRLDPALGRESDLAALAASARRHGLALLLDIVPNHMAASAEGPAFADVLTHGPASEHAAWFDVDWAETAAGHAPLLLPVLAEGLPGSLAAGEVGPERRGGALWLRAPGRRLPLDPATLPALLRDAPRRLRAGGGEREARSLAGILAQLRSLPTRRTRERGRRGAEAGAALDRLARGLRSARVRRAVDAELAALRAPRARRRLLRCVRAQPYRLAGWRDTRRLNYRRFFDVGDLIALRVEDPQVFDAVHAKLLDWVERGWIGGLRIDHVDGLRDPRRYLQRLRRAVDAARPAGSRERFPLYVEKILARGERLPRSWPVEGTTGYEFMAESEAALIDPAGAAALERGWYAFTRRTPGFRGLALGGKRRVLGDLLAPDLERLVPLARSALPGRAPPAAGLRAALRELVVHLPVYRTYADERGRLSRADRGRLEAAFAAARRGSRAPAAALDALEAVVLRGDVGDPRRAELLLRLQQVSGPAAAKGVEDTALYAHVPLASRSEVGSEPDAPLERAVAELHAGARARQRRHPRGLLAASTHDTKRSGDLRARLDALSEMPGAWLEAVERWRRWNAPHRVRVGGGTAPDPAAEWHFYQILAGLWTGTGPPGAGECEALRARIEPYLLKAAREAKERTRWIAPRPRYEAALRDFVRAALDPAGPFLPDFARVASRLVRPGAWNGLARTLVQFAAPGVPDVYQGDERLRLSLVDPDNRRPVDFAERRRALDGVRRAFAAGGSARTRLLEALRSRPEDGRLKLHLIARMGAARAAHPETFAGAHRALWGRGARGDHVIAFARGSGRESAIAIAPRLPHRLAGAQPPVGPEVWLDTRIDLPPDLRALRFRCGLSGEPVEVRDGSLRLGEVLRRLPLAFLQPRRR